MLVTWLKASQSVFTSQISLSRPFVLSRDPNKTGCTAVGKYSNTHSPAKHGLLRLLLRKMYHLNTSPRWATSSHVTLLNIHGPNIDDAAFFCNTFDMLSDLSNTILIAVGDHKVILDLHLDRSLNRTCCPYNSSAVLNNLITINITTNLVDIWRIQHPTDREYIFLVTLDFQKPWQKFSWHIACQLSWQQANRAILKIKALEDFQPIQSWLTTASESYTDLRQKGILMHGYQICFWYWTLQEICRSDNSNHTRDALSLNLIWKTATNIV